MTNKTFKPEVTDKLLKFLLKQDVIKTILSEIPYGLKKILTGCSLEIPNRYNPGVNWIAIWNDSQLKLPKNQIGLLVTLLKFTWLYSSDRNLNGFWQRVVSDELTIFMSGVRLEKSRQQRRRASREKRPWKSLDRWILKSLKKNPRSTDQELWDMLPGSRQRGSIYRDGDKVCKKEGRKSIKFRSFRKHCDSQREKIQLATANSQGGMRSY